MITKMKRLSTAVVLLVVLQAARGMQNQNQAINLPLHQANHGLDQPLLNFGVALNNENDVFNRNHPELVGYQKTCADRFVDNVAELWNAFYASKAGWIPFIFGGWLVILLKWYIKFSFKPVDNLSDFYKQMVTWMQICFVTAFLGEIIHKAGYNSYERATRLEFFQNLQLFHFMILSIKLFIYYNAATTAMKNRPDYDALMLHPNISGSPLGRFSTWTSKKLIKLGETIHGKNTFLGLIAWFGLYSFFNFTASYLLLFANGQIPGEARNANLPLSCDSSGVTYVQNIACTFEQAKWALGAWVPPLLSGHLSFEGWKDNPGWVTGLAIVSYILLLSSGLLNLFYIKVVKLATAQLGQIAGSSNTCLFRYCPCLRMYIRSYAFVTPDLTDLDAEDAKENYNQRNEEKYEQLISTAKCYKSCSVGCLKILAPLTVLTPPLATFGGLFSWALTASGFYNDPSYDLSLISLFVPIAIVMYMSSYVLYRKSIAEKRIKWDPAAWKKFRLKHARDVFFSGSYVLQFFGSLFDFGLVSFYVPLMIYKFFSYMANCAYIPTGPEWADKHYCQDYEAGELSITKSPLLLRWVIVLMGYTALTFVIFPLFGLVKISMVHNSERKFVEFTTEIMVADFNKKRVENWNSKHIKSFLLSKDGIRESHSGELNSYVDSENLKGSDMLEMVKTQEIVDFYLLFNELERKMPLNQDGQELVKKKLLHLLGNVFLVCGSRSDTYKKKIKDIYDTVNTTPASELCALQKILDKVSILEQAKLTLHEVYMQEMEGESITYASLNQLRRFKEKMEYIFDTKNHQQEYKGYGLLEEGDTIHGPGDYKWVEEAPKENLKIEEADSLEGSFRSFTSDRSSKKKCFSSCKEDEGANLMNYSRKSDEKQNDQNQLKAKSIESIKMVDEACLGCKADINKKNIKDKLNEFSADYPVRIHKVRRMEGKVWGLMKLKIFSQAFMSVDLVKKEFSFWIPFSGQDGVYLKPNNSRVRAVEFPVEFPVENPNMKFLEYDLPSPQYDLSKEKKLSALSESRWNVFRKFCQKINEIHKKERSEQHENLRKMSLDGRNENV